MSMTMSQKILAAHSGKEQVKAGELLFCNIDLALANDITAPGAIAEFKKLKQDRVWDNSKIALVSDHFTPNKDIASAEQAKIMREFARYMDIVNYYDMGNGGIEHVILPEKGLVKPGDLVIGADSHTCTYGALGAFSTGMGSTDLGMAFATGKAWFKVPQAISIVLEGELNPWVSGKDIILYLIGMIGVDGALYQSLEFSGSAISSLTMADRLTISNMAIEAGAKNGIFQVDDVTKAYLEERGIAGYPCYEADRDAEYSRVIGINLKDVPLTVSCPHLPSNSKNVIDLNNINIDQAVIGSCTNGRIEDLRVAAKVLRGRKVHKDVRCIVIPGSQSVYKQALKEGLFETFIDAEAIVTMPTCGPCLGGHTGVLAAGERAIATTNRNFVGRMGHTSSEVYLASPAVAAASAVKGVICHPDSL